MLGEGRYAFIYTKLAVIIESFTVLMRPCHVLTFKELMGQCRADYEEHTQKVLCSAVGVVCEGGSHFLTVLSHDDSGKFAYA